MTNKTRKDMNHSCNDSFFFFSSRRRHTRCSRDWSSDVCSSDLGDADTPEPGGGKPTHHAPSGVKRSNSVRAGNATRPAARNNDIEARPARRPSRERPEAKAARRARSKQCLLPNNRNMITQMLHRNKPQARASRLPTALRRGTNPTSCQVGSSWIQMSFRPREKARSEEHTSELQSRLHLVCRLLLEKKKRKRTTRGTRTSRSRQS